MMMMMMMAMMFFARSSRPEVALWLCVRKNRLNHWLHLYSPVPSHVGAGRGGRSLPDSAVAATVWCRCARCARSRRHLGERAARPMDSTALHVHLSGRRPTKVRRLGAEGARVKRPCLLLHVEHGGSGWAVPLVLALAHHLFPSANGACTSRCDLPVCGMRSAAARR